jgi:hypothetical protein
LPRPHFAVVAAGLAAVVEAPPPPPLPVLVDALSLLLLPHAATATDRPATSESSATTFRNLLQRKNLVTLTLLLTT